MTFTLLPAVPELVPDDIFLDLTAENMLDFRKGANADLGRVRDVTTVRWQSGDANKLGGQITWQSALRSGAG